MGYLASAFGLIFTGLFGLTIWLARSSAQTTLINQQKEIDNAIKEAQIKTLSNRDPDNNASNRLQAGTF